jgi:hypothetical protein
MHEQASRVLDVSVAGVASDTDSVAAIPLTRAPSPPFRLIEAKPCGERFDPVASCTTRHPPPGDDGSCGPRLLRPAPAGAGAVMP